MTCGKEKARPGGQHRGARIADTLKNLRIFRRDPAEPCRLKQNGTETWSKSGTPLTQPHSPFVRNERLRFNVPVPYFFPHAVPRMFIPAARASAAGIWRRACAPLRLFGRGG